MAREALTGHIAVMRNGGDPVPSPSPLDMALRDPAFRDGVAFLVTVDEPAEAAGAALAASDPQ